MKALTLVLSGLLISVGTYAEHYGAPITQDNAIALADALSHAGESKRLVIAGKVGSVCTAKGCWLALNDAAGEIRVSFENYGFFVPPSLVGKTVWVEGQLEKRQLSLAETRHYVADAGGDPSKVSEPALQFCVIF